MILAHHPTTRTVIGGMVSFCLLLQACSPNPIVHVPPATITTVVETATADVPDPKSTPQPEQVPTTEPAGLPHVTTQPTTMVRSTSVPTAVPSGYYESQKAKVSLEIPPRWKVTSEATSLTLDNTAAELGATITIEATNDGTTLPILVKLVKDNFNKDGAKLTESESGDAELADGVKAHYTDLIASGSRVIAMRVILAHTNGVDVSIVIYGKNPAALKSGNADITSLIKTIRPQFLLYGLDHRHTLIMAGGSPDPEGLDPARVTGSAADDVGLLFAGLVRLDQNLRVVADLADDWVVAPDGGTYTFTLRADAAFKDGRSITADDVLFSIERAADPRTKSNTARTYLGDIVGVKEMLDGGAGRVSGVSVVDPRTVVIRLDAPKPYFLLKLAYPTSFVVDRFDVTKGPEWMFKPNASGPYITREFVRDEVFVFERNPNYHAPAAIPFIVHLARVRGSLISLYQAGTIDIGGVSQDEADRINSTPGDVLAGQLHSVVGMCTTFVLFDVNQAPMDDIAVRKAFAQAIDWQKVNQAIRLSHPILATTILPPGMPGSRTLPPRLKYDIAAARSTLAGSRYAARLPKITITQSGNGNEVSPFISSLIQQWHDALGAEIELLSVDSRIFSKNLRESHGQIVPYGWCADYPDPENFLDVLFHSTSNFNESGFKNQAMDALLEQARVEPDGEQRLKLYWQVEDYLLDNVIAVPRLHSNSNTLIRPYVQNWPTLPIGVKAQLAELVGK